MNIVEFNAEEIAQRIDMPIDRWWHQCHATSLEFVRHGIVDEVYGRRTRVARGSCLGVAGQHSWVIVGDDPYDPDTVIVDPTLWSYDRSVPTILVTTVGAGRHRAKGHGPHIMQAGPPAGGTGPVIIVAPYLRSKMSRDANNWLQMFGPLDARGWIDLMSGTMVGWPAGEIIAAMNDTPELRALVPIDLLGMLTDRNPGGVYLKED